MASAVREDRRCSPPNCKSSPWLAICSSAASRACWSCSSAAAASSAMNRGMRPVRKSARRSGKAPVQGACSGCGRRSGVGTRTTRPAVRVGGLAVGRGVVHKRLDSCRAPPARVSRGRLGGAARFRSRCSSGTGRCCGAKGRPAKASTCHSRARAQPRWRRPSSLTRARRSGAPVSSAAARVSRVTVRETEVRGTVRSSSAATPSRKA